MIKELAEIEASQAHTSAVEWEPASREIVEAAAHARPAVS
jgi:hypothetical protein